MASVVVEMASIDKSYNGQAALQDFSLSVREGEFLTLLGPSGCGKTTVLRVLGGFENTDSGSVVIGGRNMASIPPEERAVNTVFQSYALFPHMTVSDNIAFGLKMAGTCRQESQDRVDRVLDMMGLSGMAGRRPGELSGGQQQRVAIARAIVNRPRVLLLDEPMSALDYGLRKRMQKDLKELQRELGITFILVTHDQEEAFTISDRVAVMDAGRIVQLGTPQEIYEEPANMYVARFVGEINVFESVVSEVKDGTVTAEVEGCDVSLRTSRPFSPGDRVNVLLRPEDFQVAPGEDADETSNRPQWPGEVTGTYYKGATFDLDVTLDGGKDILVTRFFDEDSEDYSIKEGDRVMVSWLEGWEVVLPDEGE